MAISATWIMLRKFKEKKNIMLMHKFLSFCLFISSFLCIFSLLSWKTLLRIIRYFPKEKTGFLSFFWGGESIWFFNSSRPSRLFDGQIFYEDKIANSFVKKPLINQECILKLFGMLCASSLKLEWHGARAVIFFSLIFMNMILMSIDISIKMLPKR